MDAVVERAALEHLAQGVFELGVLAQGICDGLDATRVKHQTVEQRRRRVRGLGGVHVDLVGSQNLCGTALEGVCHGEQRVVSLRAACRGELHTRSLGGLALLDDL